LKSRGFFGAFFIELILRLIADRCPKFYHSLWNLVDLGLVVFSAIDILFAVLFTSEDGSQTDARLILAILKSGLRRAAADP